MELKINLSDYWRKSSLFNLCLIIFVVIGTIAFCMWSNDKEDYIMIICALVFVVILFAVLLCSYRFLSYLTVKNQIIDSYSVFNKNWCSVDTAKTTYYAIFENPIGVLYVKQFIVLSNQPFVYQDDFFSIFKKRFIACYDLKKQIVLPYDEKTIPLLDTEKWEKVN